LVGCGPAGFAGCLGGAGLGSGTDSTTAGAAAGRWLDSITGAGGSVRSGTAQPASVQRVSASGRAKAALVMTQFP